MKSGHLETVYLTTEIEKSNKYTALGIANIMEAETNAKYVNEAVWIPTYFVLAVLITGLIANPNIAILIVTASLIFSRIALELVYRVLFDEKRLTIKTGKITFSC